MATISYPGVYVEELPSGVKRIEGVPTSTAAFVGPAGAGPIDVPIHVSSLAAFEREFGPAAGADPMAIAVRLFFANGGADAVVVRTGGPLDPDPPTGEGLRALDQAEAFGLLCLPGLYPDSSSDGATALAATLAAASSYCGRRGAILLVDPLPEWRTAADVVSGPASIEVIAAGLQRDTAAVYFPNVLVRTDAGMVEAVPSGAIAGIVARTDARRGVWRAPAGQEAALAGIVGLATEIALDDAVALQRVGVNAVRGFADVGPVVWGARTLAGASGSDSEWKYVPVRRLEIFIERSLDSGLEWTVFDPNDELLWATVRRSVGAFLACLFRRGAFAGATDAESWFVRCGQDTMSQDDIDAGVLNIEVGFAPLRPAEFVVIKLQRHAA